MPGMHGVCFFVSFLARLFFAPFFWKVRALVLLKGKLRKRDDDGSTVFLCLKRC